MGIIIKGRTIMQGNVKARAIVSKEPLSLGYIDENGAISDRTHYLYGEKVKDKILITAGLKGSAYQDLNLADLIKNDRAPKGIIVLEADTRLLSAAILCELPTMDRLETNPLEVVSAGDLVYLKADEGLIEVEKC